MFGQIAGHRAIFLARHGHGHTIPPHRVNYRANLWALKAQGATAVLAVASVGGIRGCVPGDLVLPHQLIDYTSGRAQTFFDGGDQQVVHVDFTQPYSHALRANVPGRRAARPASRCSDGGVYGAVYGPRLETAAEIDRMDRDGATLVGMTGMPEAGARARSWASTTRRCASSSIMRRAAATARRTCRWKASPNVLESAMDKVRALLQHVVPLVSSQPRAPTSAPMTVEPEVTTMIRDVLRMGDPRLLERSRDVADVRRAGARSAARGHARHDARAERRGPRRAADRRALRVVIFGVERNPRYPDAEPVPYTELINPVLTPLSDEMEDGLGRVPVGARACAASCRATRALRYEGSIRRASRSSARSTAFTRASSSTNATISTASSIRCACGISRDSASPTCCFPSLPTRPPIEAACADFPEYISTRISRTRFHAESSRHHAALPAP